MTRVALVSGANRGIGRAVARALAQDDGMVVVGGMRDPAVLPGGVSARRLDVTDARSVDDVVLHLEREHGRLDVLVNNAGI
jgi:NAD(P)-dependent dehydrogenase (short-subunit alcohol dehydrogenase family)